MPPTKWYAEQVLEAGCAMVNCMPVFIAREAYWQRRFEEEGLPIIGDDIKSQVGATITHRVLTSLFRERGVRLDKTMQLNVGGNSDFLNMLERERLESKKISKTNAVTSMLDYDLGAENVHVGPSDYVPWLTDRKWAYIRMEGSSFGDVPLNLELKLEVWDSPNSAGIVIDAVRLAKLALNNGVAGALEGPSSYLMKSPPKQVPDDEAYEATEKFIGENARTSRAAEGATARARTHRLRRRARGGGAGSIAARLGPRRLRTAWRRRRPRGLFTAAVARSRQAPEGRNAARSARGSTSCRTACGRRRTSGRRCGAMTSAGMRVPGPTWSCGPLLSTLTRRRDVIPLAAELVVRDDRPSCPSAHALFSDQLKQLDRDACCRSARSRSPDARSPARSA